VERPCGYLSMRRLRTNHSSPTISFPLLSHGPVTHIMSVVPSRHYLGFLGAYGLTFRRLLSMPLFSVHQSMSKMSHRSISHSFTHPVSLHVPYNLVTRVPLPLSNYPNTLYLFTRSDLKTIVLPVVCFPLILIPRI
jgi:hypothetical protein